MHLNLPQNLLWLMIQPQVAVKKAAQVKQVQLVTQVQ
jgi:hypothetical protein